MSRLAAIHASSSGAYNYGKIPDFSTPA